MRAAGFGFRATADVSALREALAAAGGSAGLCVLATITSKADAESMLALGRELGLPVRVIGSEAIAGIRTATGSARVRALYGTGSVAEAAALAAAGPGARLIARRAVSRDGRATAAIAEGPGE